MLLLVMSWLAMTYLGIDGITQGDPDILMNGIDYNGRICGVDSEVKDRSKVKLSDPGAQNFRRSPFVRIAVYADVLNAIWKYIQRRITMLRQPRPP